MITVMMVIKNFCIRKVIGLSDLGNKITELYFIVPYSKFFQNASKVSEDFINQEFIALKITVNKNTKEFTTYFFASIQTIPKKD